MSLSCAFQSPNVSGFVKIIKRKKWILTSITNGRAAAAAIQGKVKAKNKASLYETKMIGC